MTAPVRGRRGHGERTREDILAAAEVLLLATGSEEAVSIRAVAEAVGVTAPSIYRHFPDKDHLLFEVCSRQFDRLTEQVARSARTTADVDLVDRLIHLGRAYVRFGIGNPEHYRIMFMGHADHTPEIYADALVMETGSFGTVRDMVQEAIDAGALRPELTDAELVAHVLWAAVHGVVSLAVAKPHMPAPALEARLDAVLDVVRHGISAPT